MGARLSRNADAMKEHAGNIDFIPGTIAADRDVHACLHLFAHDSTLTLVSPGETDARLGPNRSNKNDCDGSLQAEYIGCEL